MMKFCPNPGGTDITLMKRTETPIVLRSLSLDDLDMMMKLTNDPDVVLFIPGLIQDRESMSAWISGLGKRDKEFMILLDNAPIGECSLTEIKDSGKIGIMLFPAFWRQGYGTEVIRQLILLAAKQNLKSLTATTSRMNKPCIRLLQKMGFKEMAVGWMVSEEKIDVPGPMKELFETVMFEKTLC